MRAISHKKASRYRKPKPYMALLTAGPNGTVDRQFLKTTSHNNQVIMSVKQQPGDIYEIRRWIWDANRESYLGGTVWIAIDRDGSLMPLTREEAISALHLPRVENHSDGEQYSPSIVAPIRIIPEGITP